jgi:general secretion pathway protein D
MNPILFRRSLALAVLLFLGSAAAHAQAQRPQPAPQGAQQGGAPAEAQRPPPDAGAAPPIAAGPPLPTVSLESLVERVERNSKKSFLIDRRVPQQVYLGSVKPEDVNYPTLLAILRANGMAATTIEGRVNIVPLFDIRTLEVPLVQNDDSSIPADEWVSRILSTNKKEASSLVIILRPLLPQAAHLSAMCGSCEAGAQNCTNCRQLIIVDRYGNVKRITAMVKMLDQQ